MMRSYWMFLVSATLVVIMSMLGGESLAVCQNPPCIPPTPTPPPSPTDQITAKYLSTGGVTGFLGIATSTISSTADGVGYYQNYQNGSIYWTPSTGVHETHGEIWKKYNALGGPAALGYPITDELAGPNGGRYSDFMKGSAIGSI